MSRLALLAGAVVLFSALAGSAMAQRAVIHHGHAYVRGYCSHEAGNPFSPEEDYMAWSGWRARGGWDDRPDPNCVRRSYRRAY